MTLKECIEYFEIEAETSNSLMIPYESRKKYSDDCKQMAEWLRELNELRMVLDILGQFLADTDIDVCCEDLMNNEEEQKICEKYCTFKTRGCWIRWAKMKARGVNVDENNSRHTKGNI